MILEMSKDLGWRYKCKKVRVEVLVARLCPTLCDPTDCTVHGILQAGMLEWVAISSSRGIFPSQGSNSGLPHCRHILYYLSHQGSPYSKLFIIRQIKQDFIDVIIIFARCGLSSSEVTTIHTESSMPEA